MKQRQGFVSNSSSSSFVVKAEFLNDRLREMIMEHCEYASDDDDEYSQGDAWDVKERDNGDLFCNTSMDNFDLMAFVRRIGVPQEGITDIEEGHW